MRILGADWISNCGHVFVGHGPLLLALFLAGLGGSVTHCLTMCSTFVLGQGAAVVDKGGLARLLLPYHAGRLTTYIALGVSVALGFHFLATWSGFAVLRRLMLAGVATIFLSTFAGRFLQSAGIGLPFRMPGISRCDWQQIARLRKTGSGLARYGLGLSLGMLPCPLVYAALMAVAAEASPLSAVAGMFVFGLGTMPAMLGLAFASGNILKKSPRFQNNLTLAALGINSVILLTLAVG